MHSSIMQRMSSLTCYFASRTSTTTEVVYTCCAHPPGSTTKLISNGKHRDLDLAGIQTVICLHFRKDVFGKSASWQSITGVRTSITVSSQTPNTSRGPGICCKKTKLHTTTVNKNISMPVEEEMIVWWRTMGVYKQRSTDFWRDTNLLEFWRDDEESWIPPVWTWKTCILNSSICDGPKWWTWGVFVSEGLHETFGMKVSTSLITSIWRSALGWKSQSSNTTWQMISKKNKTVCCSWGLFSDIRAAMEITVMPYHYFYNAACIYHYIYIMHLNIRYISFTVLMYQSYISEVSMQWCLYITPN